MLLPGPRRKTDIALNRSRKDEDRVVFDTKLVHCIQQFTDVSVNLRKCVGPIKLGGGQYGHVSGRPPESAPCDAVTTIRPASSGCSMPMESAQISTGSPGTSRMTKRAPSVMGGGATVGTIAARMRSAQLRTLWPGAQPSAAAARLT